jgi:hypothetical protein
LPTFSHLPVTVTGAFEVLVAGLLFELVFAPGLVAVADLFAGVLDEFTLALPAQALVMATRVRPRIRDAIFMFASFHTSRQIGPEPESGLIWTENSLLTNH